MVEASKTVLLFALIKEIFHHFFAGGKANDWLLSVSCQWLSPRYDLSDSQLLKYLLAITAMSLSLTISFSFQVRMSVREKKTCPKMYVGSALLCIYSHRWYMCMVCGYIQAFPNYSVMWCNIFESRSLREWLELRWVGGCGYGSVEDSIHMIWNVLRHNSYTYCIWIPLPMYAS